MPAQIIDLVGRQLHHGKQYIHQQRQAEVSKNEASRHDYAEKVRKDSSQWASEWRERIAGCESDSDLQEAISEAYAELEEIETRAQAALRLRIVQQLRAAEKRDLEGYMPWAGQEILLQLLQSAAPDAVFAQEEEEFLEAVLMALERSKLDEDDVTKLVEQWGAKLAEYLARYVDFNTQS